MNNKIREDLLVGALEGGSNYWYYLPDLSAIKGIKKGEPTAIRIFESVKKGAIIPVHDCENEDEKLGELSMESIKKGEALMKEKSPEHWKNAISDNSDAETADVWFQYVVLGELTFG